MAVSKKKRTRSVAARSVSQWLKAALVALRAKFSGVGSQSRVPLQVVANAVCRIRIPPLR
jgi:hypothetical protein